MTYIMTVYIPRNKEKANTKKQTVWDQQKTYYTGKGVIDKDPCDILFDDIIKQLLIWKHENCGIVLAGDFNDDVYKGKLAERLRKDNVNMDKLVFRTTGKQIPPTHNRGSKPVCAMYSTTGIFCKGA